MYVNKEFIAMFPITLDSIDQTVCDKQATRVQITWMERKAAREKDRRR